jgi:acetolactate synthase-1/2/3 large subunit
VTTSAGADLLVAGLQELGIDCVFGLPGTQVVPVFESLRRRGLRVVVPTHEMAAGFMAMGYARASAPARPGVLITIPGPGFTYALTALAEAKLDGVPLIYVTLVPTRSADGGPGFQAVDQTAMARSVVKDIIEVADADGVAGGVARAAALAVAYPQGPVLLHIVEGALGGASGAPAAALTTRTAEPVDWSGVLASLREAQRPAVVVAGDFDVPGLGILAARDHVPVCVTAAARGVVPDDHLWCLCFDDQRTPLAVLNEFLETVDFCLVLGGQLSHVATAGYELKLLEARMTWVRPGPGVGEGNYGRARSVTGEPRDLLDQWRRTGGAPKSRWSAEDLRTWRSRLAREREMALPEPKIQGAGGEGGGDSAEAFFSGLRRGLPRESIMVTDSGLHQALVRRHWSVLEPRGLLFPSDFQSMGFGIPAAIGVHLAAPERPVVALVGDGGFLMSGFELLTAVKETIPLVVIVFNDGKLNLIRLQQLREYGREHGVALPHLDFEQFAQAAGVSYFLVDGDPARTIHDALDAGGPALVEVRVGDSAAVTRTRVKGLARETVRDALGPSLVGWLKRPRP